MENQHSGIKSRTNQSLTTPTGSTVAFYSTSGNPYSATESELQTMANASSQSLEPSNSAYEGAIEQSKSVSTCSNVVHPNTGGFVDSIDSSGIIVTSSCVPAESRVVSTYQHQQSQPQSSSLLGKNMETVKRAESAVPSPCWALIEWETSNEEPSSYTVIDSSQIVEISRENIRSEEENGARIRDSGLYTGKLIHVLRGRYIMPATIVIISEDRKFLETELHELRMMAANNLIAKSVTQIQPHRKQGMPVLKHYGRSSQSDTMQTHKSNVPQNTIPSSPEHINSAKRQRCESGSSGSLKEIESRVSSASAQEAIKEEAGIPFKADFSYQKALPPVRPMAARLNRTEPAPKQAPPMTFDQQTQTTGVSADGTGSYDANIVRIMSFLESIMTEQKGYRMECEYNRRLLHELQDNIFDQHEMLRNVQKQVAEMEQINPAKNTKSQAKQTSSSDLIIADVIGKYSPEPGVGINTMVIDSYEATDNDHIVLNDVTDSEQQWETEQEQQEGNSNESWTSSNNASTQINNGPARRNTTLHSTDKATKVSSESSMSIEFENHAESTVRSPSNSATTVRDLINNDWDDSMQEKESNNNQAKTVRTVSNTTMVALGSNNTMVSKTVLDNIRWVSYKFATRKVLQAVFSREVLATHSLSGRPCPAHLAQSEKPVKGRLDPKMVADVVELIRKKFNVDESHVRAVITNKCADENKMIRLRNGTATQAKHKKAVPSRTRKSRNKENVSAVH